MMADTYHEMLSIWSDIQGHLETFVSTAVEMDAKKIIELGTRGGVSTSAWLYALEQTGGHLWAVDIAPAPEFESPHWTFIQGDDCSPAVLNQLPYDVDIVFIDTSHHYDHTIRELELYLPRVRSGGYIMLHDTELDYPDGGPSIQYPVKKAIGTFCMDHSLTWTNHEHSYGLGIIEV